MVISEELKVKGTLGVFFQIDRHLRNGGSFHVEQIPKHSFKSKHFKINCDLCRHFTFWPLCLIGTTFHLATELVKLYIVSYYVIFKFLATTAPKRPQSEDTQVEGDHQEGSVHLESGVGDIWGEIQTVTPVTLDELSQDLATELQQACQETPEGSPSKKQKFPISYSDVELDICKWFRDHPIFYDPTDLQSKNKQKKDRLMLQKAQEHNTTGQYLWGKCFF